MVRYFVACVPVITARDQSLVDQQACCLVDVSRISAESEPSSTTFVRILLLAAD